MPPIVFHLQELDRALVGAFEALASAPAGSLVANIASDTVSGKGFPKGAPLPNANELTALKRISDLLDQCIRDNKMDPLWDNVRATDVGLGYLKTALTRKGRIFGNTTPTIVLPSIQEVVRSRPQLAVQARSNVPGQQPAVPPTNVVERRGQINYERLPANNGTLRIVERDTVSGQTRDVATDLTPDQYEFLMAMTNEKPSNIVTYEVWQASAATGGAPLGGPMPPAQPAMPDNVPQVGDVSSVDPMMQELMRALQERLGR